ncbi:TPA_asm: type I glyceraldehyde-3-phosphate dehydrogenase [Listeria monocytogenes]|nr:MULTISPECIES: type I glyceraldehyde-3-phosphate dehydrogenase [Bacilli]EAC4461047.1 type I glyceraldehyde-3-phosphate dehydrogenase [Listeria monocytogenes]EAC6576712.1 type I glyceraldehyde-3-phosphate dehydrogenase [Listeria monocytogenes]EAC6588639.1 type I glyceraldehyde-3-phosphate dehydrogenase [Listeria monocytogenes]EAD5700071.1 type I glyceraldehyde-3-phosphate dehydrogenase [Listeria monocytogenes]EAD5703176.1 type I glyceraldehyde-3-phosphate dehydrogenase [Listeria monocytogenes
MTTKIAINGFGRIGRLMFRQLVLDEEIEIVAINDLTNPEMLAHLVKYDTTQGTFKLANSISHSENSLILNDTEIPIYVKENALELPWAELGVDIVLECTGFYTSSSKASQHIEAGAKKVIVSAPAGNDMTTIVYGVNHETLTSQEKIISAASCTTHCLALMANTLNQLTPIVKGSMTTIHAYTGDQMTLDGPHRGNDLRRARAAAVNIIPTSSGAAKAIGLVIPELNGKLDGISQRVPVPAGSLTELVSVVDGVITKEEINATMKAAANEYFGYTEDQIVSSDVIGMNFGSLFDGTQTMVTDLPNNQSLVKTVSWYDNENSFVSQMVRITKYLTKL